MHLVGLQLASGVSLTWLNVFEWNRVVYCHLEWSTTSRFGIALEIYT